jgi:hypothetical protein
MMLLFVALQPGVLLTLPAVGRSVFMSGKMSVQAVFVHALIFALVVYFFRRGGYFEGFVTAASPAVVNQTAVFSRELGRPTIALERLDKIDTYVKAQLKNLNASVKYLMSIQERYAGKPVPANMKATLDNGSAEIAKKQADIALYQSVADMISKKRAELKAMVQKTIASASASLPPAVVSQLKQSASQLSASQIAALQKVVAPMVTAAASPSAIANAVKSIVPSISMPSMMSGSMSMPIRTASMPKIGGTPMASMMSASMPTSLTQAKALASKSGFNF